MTTPTFGELLAKYMLRAGISDSELARTIGVQRQTIFRWKEGIVARPRVREDVLRCASKLRLTREERDQLLLAAGFPPEILPIPAADAEPLVGETVASTPGELADPDVKVETTVEPAMPIPQPRHWVRWAGVALAAMGLVVGWLLWSGRSVLRDFPVATPAPSSVSAFWQASQVAVTPPKLSLTPTLSTTPSPPPTSTAAIAPWPTAAPTEMLLVVAPFTGYNDAKFDVASRIEEKLQEQIDAFSLPNTFVQIWPRSLQNKVEAGQVLTATQATIVIWGAYDDGRVQVNWFVRNGEKAEKSDFSLTPPKDLAVTINENVPNEMQSVALYTFGRLLQSNHNLAQAERAYRLGLQLNPSNDRLAALLNFYLGRILSVEQKSKSPAERLRNYDEVLKLYTAAYERNPSFYNALYNRGTVWLNQASVLTSSVEITASLTAAITDLTELLERPDLRDLHARIPEFANAYFNRGLAYYHRKQPNDAANAVADLTQVTRLAPQNPHGWYQRSLAYIHVGNDLAWPADLTRTLALSPTYGLAYDALCWGYALAQQPEAALPHCTQALTTQAPPDPSRTSHDAFGIVYAQLGRYAEAIGELEKYVNWIQVYHPQEYSKFRGPEAEGWIALLKTKRNPFDAQTLAHLR